MSENKKVRREPEVGEVFQHRHKGTMYTLTVVTFDDGIAFELLGKVYKSPTAAAKAIVGKDQQTNGRSFWHMNK